MSGTINTVDVGEARAPTPFTSAGSDQTNNSSATAVNSNANQENIKVAVRLRPFTEKEKQRNCKRCVDIEQNTVALYSPKYDENIKRFTFDHSYWSHDGFKRSAEGVNVPDESHPNCTKYVGQERVFADLGRFLLENALQGYNSALLAYGQTGSGKSYTVSGYGKNEGILPRFARELFVELEKQCGSCGDGGHDEGAEKCDKASTCNRFEVYFSMIEIYNEVVRDLLAKGNGYDRLTKIGPSVASMGRRGIRVREHPKRGFFVENLTSVFCAKKEEIERLIEEGQLNKSIAATSMNETSSRGHTIYEFRIKQFKTKPAPEASTPGQEVTGDNGASPSTPKKRPAAMPGEVEMLTTSVVQLVDLAGSERTAVHVTADETFAGNRSSSPFRPATRDDLSLGSKGKRSSSTRRLPPTSAASLSSSTSVGGGQQVAGSSSLRRPKESSNALHPTGSLMSNHQQRFKESVSINQSLSALGNCIQVLSQHSQQQLAGGNGNQQQPKIPYRDSVLTKLLNRCCLSGKSKVAIIATLSPADANYDDTLSTLRFADRAKQIRTHATINRMSRGEMVNALQRENERLKQILDGRVTRSDDSSQTSNFDDTENMHDNFNGPRPGRASTPPPGSKLAKGTPAAHTDTSKAVRGRTSTRQGAMAQQRDTRTTGTSKRTPGAGIPVKGRRQTSRSTTRLDGQKMKQLVSPAAAKTANENVLGEGADRAGQLVRKSRSVGQGLAGESYDLVRDEQELELVSGLLDDIELNDELANIDDENLISPDSDDSSAALASDERLTNEEKIDILNKLLGSTDLTNKMAAAQRSRAEAGQQQTHKMSRPRKAGAGRGARGALDEELSRVTAISSSLKLANPFLSNLNPDEQLTGMISYLIKPGEMIVGKNSSESDLLIYGPEMRGRHAKLTRVEKLTGAGDQQVASNEVFIEPILEDQKAGERLDAAQKVALFVNGEPVRTKTKLNHCDRLLFGSNAYFVFIDNTSRSLPLSQQAASSEGEPGSSTLADPDLVTYDMAHNEVLHKMMNDSQNEAMIREINYYTHRPGTGKRPLGGGSGGATTETITSEPHESPRAASTEADSTGTALATAGVMLSGVRNTRLTRSMTIHDEQPAAPGEDATAGAQTTGADDKEGPPDDSEANRAHRKLGNIREEESDMSAAGQQPGQVAADLVDESFREKLMEDIYEFAMPVAEANAIVKEMGIKVTYGLKILTGEEQLLQDQSTELDELEREGAASGDPVDKMAANMEGARVQRGRTILVTRNAVNPLSLDLPPKLYVQVHLDELDMNFYWSKEKFQGRRVKMLELYGAWDVGGKSGLVEYLIEQSKYQGYYMIDPFIDDLQLSWLLIGHAQVTLRPISHMSDLRDSFDILDVDDNIVGSLQIEAVPCHTGEDLNGADKVDDEQLPYKVMNADELASNFVSRPEAKLLGRKIVFMLRIGSCVGLPERYSQIFCQYTLDRYSSIVQTATREQRSMDAGTLPNMTDAANRVTNYLDGDTNEPKVGENSPSSGYDSSGASEARDSKDAIDFEHWHFVVVDEVNQDILDFLQHGFLTIQVVGQYRMPPMVGASGATNSQQTGACSSSSRQSSSNQQRQQFQPTLITTIINSINKYRFRIEHQEANRSGTWTGSSNNSAPNGSVYANSFSDSPKSNRINSSGPVNSNSGAGSITSASATINLFDQQNDDDEGNSSLNEISQENIIDMILTKRKLDRAENQLHYLKRTINIAEHYNKKHIPIKTVKKLLSSYGHEIEDRSIEEIATEATGEGKATSTKQSACSIQ